MPRTMKAKAEPTVTTKAKPKPKPGGKKSRMSELNSVADEFAGWLPGREVLTPVYSVPTIFPQFDVATRVRGFPIQRICLVHGPSNEGKTVLSMGLGRSFLEAGHYYFHVDAEMTTPEPWVQENLRQFADSPRFRALRPESYEETASKVRDAAKMLRAKRDNGEHVSALFVIDSIQKLVPRDLMAKLLEQKKGEENVDAMKGRGGMIQAALNTAWMRELVPLMYHANAGMLLIGRESQNTKATGLYDKAYVVGGGNAIYYDSSLVCRVTRDGWVERGSDKAKEQIGERIRVDITKTKVGHKDGKTTRCFFHTSNGKLIGAGFDRARDVIELGLRAGVLKMVGAEKEPAKKAKPKPHGVKVEAKESKGTTVVDVQTGDVYGSTLHKAVEYLTDNVEALDDLQRRVLDVAQPDEIDDDRAPEDVGEP